MKKLLIISTVAILAIASYSQTTTQQQDSVAVQQASIDALDLQYKSQTNVMAVRYTAQRNSMLRQLEKLQSTNIVNNVSH